MEKRISHYYILLENKITTEWKSAPKVCFFCDKEGHVKRDCEQYQKALALCRHFKEYQSNKNKEKTPELISSLLDEKTTSVSSSSIQEMSTDEHLKNSLTEEQQDTSRANESNNTQDNVSERTENITLTTEDTNMRENSETQEVGLTDNTTFNKEITQEVTSPMVIINNNNHELQELNCSEGEYITATNKRKKDKKKVPAQKQEETRTAPYKKKTCNESQNIQI